jgi:hypothetical protein
LPTPHARATSSMVGGLLALLGMNSSNAKEVA